MSSTIPHQESQKQQEQQQQTTQTSTIPYPHAPDRALHITLTTLATSYLIFLTSTSSSASLFSTTTPAAPDLETNPDPDLDLDVSSSNTPRSLSPLGSFIYGLPNVCNPHYIMYSDSPTPQRFSPTEPLTTPLISVPDTEELATRICRILVIRLAKLTGRPRAVYVGCSIAVDGLVDRVREGLDVLGCVVEEIGRLVEVQSQQQRGQGKE